MKISLRLFALSVLLYVYSSSIVLADSACDTVRQDISQIQSIVRQAEVNMSGEGLKQISDLARSMKSVCMQSLSSIDLTQGGLYSGWGNILVQAANRVCDSMAQRVPSPNLDINSVLNQVMQQSGVNPNVVIAARDVAASDGVSTQTVSGTWDRLRDFFR